MVVAFPKGTVDHFIGVVACIEVHKALQSCILLVLEFSLNFFFFPHIGNLAKEMRENIGSAKLVTFK